MKLTLGELRQLIRETLYKAKAPDGKVTHVEAESTMEAGELAAQKFGGGVDPFTIDLQPQSKHIDISDLDPNQIVEYHVRFSDPSETRIKNANLIRFDYDHWMGKNTGYTRLKVIGGFDFAVGLADVARWFGQHHDVTHVKIVYTDRALMKPRIEFLTVPAFLDMLDDSGMPH